MSQGCRTDCGLELRGVSKAYGSNPESRVSAVEAFDLQVRRGEFVAFFGPNGCGKTTVLLLIAGFLKPDAGEILRSPNGGESARPAMVFQDFIGSLYPWRNVVSNVAFPLEIQGIGRRRARKKASETLAKLGFELPLKAYPYQLSGGQQQMLAIARAWIYEPDLLLLDEPFGALDFHIRLGMQKHLSQALASAPTPITTLLVSHDVEDALAVADRIVVLARRPTHPVSETRVGTAHDPKPRNLGDERLSALRRELLAAFTEVISQ